MVLHSGNHQSYMDVCKEIQSNSSNHCQNILLKAKHFSLLVEHVLAVTKVSGLHHECLYNI